MAKKAAADTKAKKPRKRERQTQIPGTEETEIPEILSAATNYVDVRDQRCELSKDETEAHDHLLEMLRKHKRDNYRLPDGSLVHVVPGKTKVRVDKPADQKPEDLQDVDA